MAQWREQGADLGLLVMRLVIGGLFAVEHGWDKVQGGTAGWVKLGKAVKYIGIDDYYQVFGGIAAWTEFAGGILLVLGLFLRPAAFLLACTMGVATAMHLGSGDGLRGAAHALELGATCLGLMLLGAGRFSLDQRLFGKRDSTTRRNIVEVCPTST